MVSIISGLIASGCSVFGIRTEQMPSYTVERVIGPADERVELRRYGPRLAAETVVSGSEADARNRGFRTLAGFIFGRNSAKTSIAMTAPVSQSIDMTAPVAQSRAADGQWRIRFFMPSEFTRDSLPRPTDPNITILTVPPQTIAVLRYSGGIGPAAVHRAEHRLVQIVADAGLQTEGDAFTWFYDPPWTLPPLRRNEAAILVHPD